MDKKNIYEKHVLVKKLCLCLEDNNINYCHWKSNAALDKSFSGENDLDLLVDRKDSQAFIKILFTLGFKEINSPRDFLTPGVHNYFGFDINNVNFVNVHVHFQLLVGHDLTKNYHIPIELPYINSSKFNGLFRVPEPEFELIILIIRLAIKHFTIESILLLEIELSESEKNEVIFLKNQISKERIRCILQEHFSYISELIFFECLDLITHKSISLKGFWKFQKLLQSVNIYSLSPRYCDLFCKVMRRFLWPINQRIFRRDYRKKFNNGGLLIAVIGGDGAGKTTAVDEIFNWLRTDFSIQKFHLGKPKWSFSTYIVRGFIKIGRIFGFYPFQSADVVYSNDSELINFPGYQWAIREICTARDRYLTYKKARKIASRGGLIIFDRFPLSIIKFMDGPQISRMTSKLDLNLILKFLIEMEENYYKKISLPELIIVLKVNPDIAVSRKRNEIEDEVRPRSTEIWTIDWKKQPVCIINANNSLEEVISELKEMIWSRL